MTILPRSVNAACRDYRLRRNDLPAASHIVRTSSRRGRPLALLAEAGVTNWLSLSFLLPVVRTRHEVYLRPNPAGTEGNISVNPYLATSHSNANDLVQSQLLDARSA